MANKITSTYTLMKAKISKGNYDPEEVLDMLDTFYVQGRIGKEQYEELTNMVRKENSEDVKHQND